jgi:2-polyprenyl-3-methyl-5-hydroxy-6-metoxy-1,4-benzoquinol methylase
MRLEMVGRACPVCGSRDASKVYAEANFDVAKLDEYAFASRKMPEYMHHRLIECPVCDLVYANPVPTMETLSSAYNEAAFDSAEEARHAARTYGSFLPAIASRLPDRCGALDIGTGDGVFLEQLLSRGFSGVMGVEPSAAPIAAARPRIRPLIKHDIFRPEDYQPGSFSLITCFQTIEHLSDPLEMCRDAHRLLKEGGALLLIGHNRRAVSATLLGKKSPIFDIEHLQLFSPRSARQLLKCAGFRSIELKTVLNSYPLHYWLKLFPIPTAPKRKLIDLLKRLKIGYLQIPLPAGNMAVIGYRVSRQ